MEPISKPQINHGDMKKFMDTKKQRLVLVKENNTVTLKVVEKGKEYSNKNLNFFSEAD